VGIDLSAAMLAIASGTAAIRNRLVLADCLQLPFHSCVFDFALSSFALNHIQHLDSMARELARTMKHRGRLLICEMHPDAYAQGWRPGFRDARSAVQIETVSHSTESIVSRFRTHGFACEDLCDLFFEESERAIFLEAGKESTFKAARDVPAIQVYQFGLMASGTSS
jgi:ubiquinone/menaquinone biosynthesis C-methylase UbiE